MNGDPIRTSVHRSELSPLDGAVNFPLDRSTLRQPSDVLDGRVASAFMGGLATQPLYRRLLAGLLSDIQTGKLRPGDLIPPEVEIARHNGISRHTVRQAIVELTREGLVRRERGKGTFVLARPLVQSLRTFYSFAHEMRERGLPFHTRVLHRTIARAQMDVARRLSLEEGAEVIQLELLRIVEGSPLSLEFCVFPHQRFPSLMDADLRFTSIYEVIAQQHGVYITGAHEQLRPVVLDRRQADLLDTKSGAPAFHVDRLTSAGALPIEWRRSLIRGDRYLFRVDLPVQPEPGKDIP